MLLQKYLGIADLLFFSCKYGHMQPFAEFSCSKVKLISTVVSIAKVV